MASAWASSRAHHRPNFVRHSHFQMDLQRRWGEHFGILVNCVKCFSSKSFVIEKSFVCENCFLLNRLLCASGCSYLRCLALGITLALNVCNTSDWLWYWLCNGKTLRYSLRGTTKVFCFHSWEHCLLDLVRGLLFWILFILALSSVCLEFHCYFMRWPTV